MKPRYAGKNEYPNDYPSQFAFCAIYRHLFRWVREGIVPPVSPRIELDENMDNKKDDLGNALGGIRLPQMDAPVCTYYNYSDAEGMWDGKNVLFGHIVPFGAEKLKELYGSLQEYRNKVETLADMQIAKGFLLEEDREECVKNAVEKAGLYGLK